MQKNARARNSPSVNLKDELSSNYLDFLDQGEEHNVIINAGVGENSKVFRAHSLILRLRSPYFRTALSPTWAKKNEKGCFLLKLENISPEVMEIILKYIYGGIISFPRNSRTVCDLIFDADELQLSTVTKEAQKCLTRNHQRFIMKNLVRLLCVTFQNENLAILHQHLASKISDQPELLFKAHNFCQLKEGALVDLLKENDLCVEETIIWEQVLKWGIANCSTTLDNDHSKWTDVQFQCLAQKLQNCIPLVRFHEMTSADYYRKVFMNYQKLLPEALCKRVTGFFLNPSDMNRDAFPSRFKRVDSVIVSSPQAKRIAERLNMKGLFEFKLLIRGSRDGFDPNKFHGNCDQQNSTVVFVKILGHPLILGGYNPLDLSSNRRNSYSYNRYNNHNPDVYITTDSSFLFSFPEKFSGQVEFYPLRNSSNAIYYSSSRGPCFGCNDLWLQNNNVSCSQSSYEGPIAEQNSYSIEDYEVFKIMEKKPNTSFN